MKSENINNDMIGVSNEIIGKLEDDISKTKKWQNKIMLKII